MSLFREPNPCALHREILASLLNSATDTRGMPEDKRDEIHELLLKAVGVLYDCFNEEQRKDWEEHPGPGRGNGPPDLRIIPGGAA